jgi:hypothetical protein
MSLFYSKLLFLSLISLVYSKSITNLYSYNKYNIIKDNIYLYNIVFDSNILNFQCNKFINIYCFDDENKIKKHFNGSYSDYIKVIKSDNIIFNLNDTKKIGQFFFISDYSSQCTFFNINEEYIINGISSNNIYHLNIPYKIEVP